MSTRASQKVTRLLATLSEAFPSLTITDDRLAVWSEVLDLFSEKQLAKAGILLSRHFKYGKPSTADVVEAIKGKLVKVPVYATDLWGRRILDSPGGRPIIESWKPKRVPYGTDELEIAELTEPDTQPLGLPGGD